MNPTSKPDLETAAPPLAAPATAEPASWTQLSLAALPIVLSGSLMVNTALSLPVRGVSAILCGLAVLLTGPHLFAQSLTRWARPRITLAG